MSYIHQLLKQAYMMFLALLTPCESKPVSYTHLPMAVQEGREEALL